MNRLQRYAVILFVVMLQIVLFNIYNPNLDTSQYAHHLLRGDVQLNDFAKTEASTIHEEVHLNERQNGENVDLMLNSSRTAPLALQTHQATVMEHRETALHSPTVTTKEHTSPMFVKPTTESNEITKSSNHLITESTSTATVNSKSIDTKRQVTIQVAGTKVERTKPSQINTHKTVNSSRQFHTAESHIITNIVVTKKLKTAITQINNDDMVFNSGRQFHTLHGIEMVTDPLDVKLLHSVNLHAACMGTRYHPKGEAIIPWNYNSIRLKDDMLVFEGDDDLFQYLSRCTDIDVYIPGHLRDYGYCEDAMAYVKYSKGRGLPNWVFTKELRHPNGSTYHYTDLCPHTPIIFLQHYWDGVTRLPTWRSKQNQVKPIYWMPNVEMISSTEQLDQSSLVLCKTNDCVTRFTKYLIFHSNPRKIQVYYTRHTTTDITILAKLQQQQNPDKYIIKDKIFDTKHPSFAILHVAGTSIFKSTRQVLTCWHKKLELPKLHLLAHSSHTQDLYQSIFGSQTQPNVQFDNVDLSPVEYGKLLLETGIVLCPSEQEGYGHYINQARAASAFVITTNGPPMNELITSDEGLLFSAPFGLHSDQILGPSGGVPDMAPIYYQVSAESVCRSIQTLVDSVPDIDRVKKANLARQVYIDDLRFFENAMKELVLLSKKRQSM